MKKTLGGAALAVLALNALAGIPVSGGPSSNPAHAVKTLSGVTKVVAVTEEFIKLMYSVPAKDIRVVPKEMEENTAVVAAAFLTQRCELFLVKHPTANEHGWVVQKHSCSKAK